MMMIVGGDGDDDCWSDSSGGESGYGSGGLVVMYGNGYSSGDTVVVIQ